MAADNAQTRRERVEAREEAILTAAHAVFAEHGFDGAKMADIARAARVAEGTVYLYFKNKQALLEAVIARFYARLTFGAQEGVKSIDDTFERLAFLARHHVSQCMAQWHILELMIGMYRRLHDYENRGYQFNKAYVAVFDQAFRDGVARGDLRDDVPLWVVRDQFYGALEYMTRTLMLRGQDGDDTDVAVACAMDLLRRGAQRRAAASPAAQADIESVTRRLEDVALRLEQQR